MRLFIWDKREDLVRKDGRLGKGTVMVISETLPSAIAFLRNPKASGYPEDMVTDQIHNLPDVNVQVLCKTTDAWVHLDE
jgi:hypothetical protein